MTILSYACCGSNYCAKPTVRKSANFKQVLECRTKSPPERIPFTLICTGGQNPLHGFTRVDIIPFMVLQGWT